MTHRTIQVVVRRTVTYERVVTVQVEETAERLADEKNPRFGERYTFIADAKDAAIEKAPTLTGWEPSGQIEYESVSAQVVPAAKNVDVVV